MMDNNLIMLLVSGTVAFTSAGFWLWTGKRTKLPDVAQQQASPDLVTEPVDPNVGLLDEELVHGFTEKITGSELNLTTPLQDVVIKHCQMHPGQVLSDKEIDIGVARQACDALIESTKGALEDVIDYYFDTNYNMQLDVEKLRGLEKIGARALESQHAISLTEEINLAQAKIQDFTKSMAEYRKDLKELVSDWLILNDQAPVEGTIIEDLVDLQPGVFDVPAPLLSNTDLLVIALFTCSVIFFISGLVYRYRTSKPKEEEPKEEEPKEEEERPWWESQDTDVSDS